MKLDNKYDRSKRKLILLNHDTAMLLNIFHIDDEDTWETMWYDEISDDYPPDFAIEAADEFVKQFRDNASPYFFKCLADRCNKEYQKWEDEHGEKYRKLLEDFEKQRNKINENNSTK